MPRSQAQKRWEKRHQRITVFLSKDLKESLERVKGRRTYAEIIREAVNDVAESSRRAEELYTVKIPCFHCGRPVVIVPGGPIHRDILSEQARHHRWQHDRC